MKALCIWPSKGHFLLVPQLDNELGYSCSLGYRKRGGPGDFLFHNTSSSFSLVSRNSRPVRSGVCCGSSKSDIGCWSFSGQSKLRVVLFGEIRNKGFCGALVTLAWALDQEALGDELVKEESNYVDGLSGEAKDDENVSSCNVNEVEGNDKEAEFRTEEEVGEKKNKRIDVRRLAWNLRSAKTADDVEEVLKDMDELPYQVYSRVIKGLGKDKLMDSANALVEWLKRKKNMDGFMGPNIYIYNSLLGAAKQSAQYGEADKIMNVMAQEGIIPSIVTYNTMMAIFAEQGKLDQALNVLEEIREKGWIPSAISYSTALLAYRSIGDGHGAVSFFVNFREKYTKGDIRKDTDEDWDKEFAKLENLTLRICYEVMRGWLVNSENLSRNVLKLLTVMDKASIHLSREDLQRLVWACTREEHYFVAKDLYGRIRERHSEISLSVCNHVIWLMGKAKKWWAALEIYEDLLDKGPKPDNMSYELIVSHFNFLLSAAKKKGIWRWGVRLIDRMEDKGLKPGTKEWNAVLAACSKAGETSAAVQIFKRMVDQGEKPTIVSYGTLLSALEKGKLYDEAFRVWNHMNQVGLKPNSYAYTIMASVFTAQEKFDMVDALIQDMVASGVEPTVVTYNAIISGCAQNATSSVAYEWFHRMKVQNIQPDEITYEMLVQALAKDGKPRLAYELFLRARKEGLNLSAKTYDVVLDSARVYGATVDLSALGPRPADQRKKVQPRKDPTELSNVADIPRRSKPFGRKELYTPQEEGTNQ